MKHKPTKKQPIAAAAKPATSRETRKSAPAVPGKELFPARYLPAVMFGAILLMVLIVFFDFITGARYYLFKDIGSDSLNGYYPYVVNTARYWVEEGFPRWSFAVGMGQSVFPGGFQDPYAFIINMFGPDGVAYGIIVSDVLKYLTTAMVFFLYLRVMNTGTVTSVVGSLLFTMSGFMVVAGSWYTFSLEVVYMAFLLFAFEMLYRRNNLVLFPIAIALIGMYVPFDVFLYGLFLIIYMLFRFFSDDEPRAGKFFILTAKMAALTVLGLMISAVFFAPNLQRLIDSPRVSGNTSYFATLMSKPIFSTAPHDHNVTAVMRAFGNDLIGNGSKFGGWYNYLEAPLFYIGLLPLLLFTQVFTMGDRRRKILYGAFLAIYLVPVVFPFFRNAFWAFTGDYYRGFSLFFSFVLLYGTLQVLTSLEKGGRVNLFVLAGTAVVLLALVHFPYQGISQIIRKDLLSVVTIFLVLYALLILLFNFTKNRTALKWILAGLVFLELAYFNGKTVRERDSVTSTEWRQKTGYNDYTVEAVDWIRKNDGGFYRINKDYSSGPAIHRSINDALVQGYYGTPCYSSFNQKYYIRFLEVTGVVAPGREDQTRWAPGVSTRPLLQIMASVKYNLSNKEQPFFQGSGYDPVHREGDVKILKNRYFLPLGYTYDRYIPIGEYKKLKGVQRDYTLLEAFIAEEPLDKKLSVLQPFTLNDTLAQITFGRIDSAAMARRADTLQTDLFSENHISGKISLDQPKMLFFSIPYDRGWQARVNGKPVEPELVNAGFMGFFLDKGDHTVELTYRVHNLALYGWLTVAGILILLAVAIVQNRAFLAERLRTSRNPEHIS